MPKFIVDNVVIEKSDKDIKTGVKYNFNSALNIVCGDNEAGKSSLMTFMKECFFRPNKIDTGKIFFSVCENDKKNCYRADIKNNQKKEKRCILFDNNDLPCEYSILEKFINKKYYESGFTINLDDLTSLQYDNNKTLANVIKDPSGDKLNEFMKQITSEIDYYLGVNGKSRKPLSEIKDKISALQNKINELSQKENQYNSALLNIRDAEEEIRNLAKEEEYINLSIQLNKEKEELASLNEKLKILDKQFNIKLFNAKEQYFELLQKMGKFDSNIDILSRNKQKIGQFNLSISSDINDFNHTFSTNLNESDINNFNIDFAKVNKIKELISKIENSKNEINAYKKSIEDIEQTILKLKNDFEYLEKINCENCELSELENLYNKLNDALKQYKFIESELLNLGQNSKQENILSVKNVLIIIGLLTVFCGIFAIMSFYSIISSTFIFSIFFLVLIGTIIAVLRKGNVNNSKDNEKERKILQQKEILKNVVEAVQDLYPDITDTDSYYLPVKLDEIKQDVNTKLINLKSFNEKVILNKQDTEFNNKKINNINDKIAEINSQINTYFYEIETIKSSDEIKLNVEVNQYPAAIEMIKTIKQNIDNKNILEKENEELIKVNNEIVKSFNSFIIENNINFNADVDLKNNIFQLKQIYDNNNNLKQQIDLLNVSVGTSNVKINDINKSLVGFEADNYYRIDNERLEEIAVLKKQKQTMKTEAEFQKRELESFEGITDIKNERNLLINDYRNIVKKLFINKAICKLSSIAKSNFDKTQPDLVNAQKYLSILTDGKYTKINLETEEILNENGNIIKKWNELSRGTKEQLYLALRLGYASNYSKDKSTLLPNGRPDLPLIVDDAFVNFDYKRTQNALKCLIEFSRTNQVIFFTCHTEMIKHLLKEINEEEKLNYIYIN